MALPAGSVEGDTHVFETEIQDDYIVNNFENTFYVNVIPAEEKRPGGNGDRHTPTDPKNKGNRQTPSRFAIPEIIPVKKDEWEQYEMGRFSALVYRPTENGGDYFLNMDNDYLLTELKSVRDRSRIELTKARYTYSMALIGMSIVSYYKNHADKCGDTDAPSAVKLLSEMISPILIPMLESMADLEIDNSDAAA